MISLKLHNLAVMLQIRPEMARYAAVQLEELSQCVAQIERATIPPQLLNADVTPLPENVVRLRAPMVRQ